jgi:hypothetical protein
MANSQNSVALLRMFASYKEAFEKTFDGLPSASRDAQYEKNLDDFITKYQSVTRFTTALELNAAHGSFYKFCICYISYVHCCQLLGVPVSEKYDQ